VFDVVFQNTSGAPFLKSEMPRVLMPGETDATVAVEKQEGFGMEKWHSALLEFNLSLLTG
jgi:hypothetical protein